mmetsp:Transcript_92285/g.246786  ORF Transcript_92285/g.246786 Transcript_92285/m.246786 type:complete len:228 (+) Transcript_92285:2522-3205(+)
MGLLELIVLDVHLDSQIRLMRAQIGPLRLVELTGLGVVRSQLLVVGSCEIRVLRVVQQLLGFVPLAGVHRGLDGLLGVPGLDVVVDGGVDLLLRHQPIPPLLLQLHHQRRRLLLRQLHCLGVRVPPAVGIHGLLDQAHTLIELSSLVMHARRLAGCADTRRAGHVVLQDHLGGLGRHAGLEIQLNCLLGIAFLFLQLRRLVLLLGRQQPLQVLVLQLQHVAVVLLLG